MQLLFFASSSSAVAAAIFHFLFRSCYEMPNSVCYVQKEIVARKWERIIYTLNVAVRPPNECAMKWASTPLSNSV